MSLSNIRVFAAGMFVAAAMPSPASDLVVTSLADSGPGSLRAALLQANPTPPSDYPQIFFSVSGVIKLESPLILERSMQIDGGGRIVITGQSRTQVLRVPCCESGSLRIQNLTIANGKADSGGGISHAEYSPLFLKNVTFKNNSATIGGALYSPVDADVSIDSCTFVGNSATKGGAIFTHINSELTIVNSTFSGNHATMGGAIYEHSSRTAISFSTFSGNGADQGGALYQEYFAGGFPPVALRNTIVANSAAGGNCACRDQTSGCITDAGGNLSYPDNTCPGIVADPKLEPLATNGGLTKTMSLSDGSPAIDAAADCRDFSSVVASDQRGIPRPQGLRCDIGAYERSAINFMGFYSPISNLPSINNVNAGSAIPIQFSAGGYLGMSIVAAGYPKSQAISCETALPTGTAVPIDTPGASGLTYDNFSRTYTIVWKTEEKWEAACRQLVLRLTDGVDHVGRFRFR